MLSENLPPFAGIEDTGEGRTLAECACSFRRGGDSRDHLLEAAVQGFIPRLRPVPRHTSGFKPAPNPLTRHVQEFGAILQAPRHLAMQREAAFFRKAVSHSRHHDKYTDHVSDLECRSVFQFWRPIIGRLKSVWSLLEDRQSGGKDDFPQVHISALSKIHLPKSDKARHDKMVALVEQMLDLRKRKATATGSDGQERLQRLIDSTDKQIDALVYELYGLTADEIKIVEGTC